jgi:hypothetical protein
MPKGLPRTALIAGLALIVLAIALCISLELLTRWEQARTLAKRDFGVAVIGIAIGLPMLISGAAGLLCLVIAGGALVHKRIIARIPN